MNDENISKREEPKTLTIGFRITPENRELLDHLVDIFSEQLGTRVSRAQAFNVAVKESVERKEKP